MSLPSRSAAGSLQRRSASGDQDSRLPNVLREFESEDAARQIQRLADQDIVLELQLTGFDPASPAWLTFARSLAEYGYAVFVAWGATGLLRRRAANQRGGKGVLGYHRIPENLQLPQDQAEELAGLLVTRALIVFRETLANPKTTWRIDGGASIKTYFVGGCLMVLPDVFEPWWRDEQPILGLVDPLELLPEEVPSLDDPAQAVESLLRVEAHFAGAPVVREMFMLQNRGYLLAEIAEMLGDALGRPCTEAAVRSAMSRARRHPPQTPSNTTARQTRA